MRFLLPHPRAIVVCGFSYEMLVKLGGESGLFILVICCLFVT